MKYALIFDMDGVIVDSNPYHKIALQRFCKEHNHNLTEELLREKVYGRTNRDWLLNLFGYLEEGKIKQYANEKEALYRELYAKDIKPVDGLIEFLDKIKKANISRAIATSAPRANVDFTLDRTNTASYFDIILDDSFVSRGKPDPEIYTKSCEAVKLPPAQCIVFEDSLSGVESAKTAGCKVVGISTTHTAEELKNTDLVIENFKNLDLAELEKLIKS